nr:Ig-like domain-containing protein [Terrimesophilobacter mesophilus]
MPPVVTSPIGNVALGTNTVITNSTGATVTGTGEPGATLDIVGNACMITPTIVDASGNWTCQLTTPMTPDGTYDVFFGQTDAALNSSPLASPYIHFDVDTIAPGAPSVTTPSGPSSGGVMRASTKETHPVITGTGEYGATARIYVGGSAPVACDESPLVIGEGGFTCTVKNTLSPGVYYFGFSQTDAAGNSSGAPVVRLQLTVVAPPPAPVILPTLGLNWFLQFASDSNAPAPGQNVTLTGSDLPAGATVSAELHSTPVDLGTAMVRDDGTFTLNTVIPSTVEPGAHHYVVTVTPLTGEPQTSELPVTVVAAPPPAIPQPVVPASPTDGATTTGTGDPVGSESRDTPSSPNQLSNALPTLQDIISNPLVIGAAAASSLALLFLVAFPAEILNSTLDENYERIFGRIPRVRMPWLARLRDRLKRTPAVGGLALTTLAALILSFADPRFGFDLASLRLFLACAIGMFVLGFIANAVTGIILKRRWNITSVIELQPFGLVVAIVGVILSRALDFAPGLLVGLVLGLSLSASASLKEESRAVLTWFGVILGLSVLGWIGYSFFSGVVAPGTFAGALVDDSIVAIATEGISGLVIGLLPIGFLDGRTVFRNSRWQWIGTYVLTLVAFFVIVVPSGALWGDISGPFWIWLVVLLAFAALCIGVYLWFRAHPESEDDAAVDAESTQSDSDISDRDKSVHQY